MERLLGSKGRLSYEARKEGTLLKTLSAVLVGLGIWLIIDGVLSIVKYHKQTFPEQLIRIIRATVGIVIVFVAIAAN